MNLSETTSAELPAVTDEQDQSPSSLAAQISAIMGVGVSPEQATSIVAAVQADAENRTLEKIEGSDELLQARAYLARLAVRRQTSFNPFKRGALKQQYEDAIKRYGTAVKAEKAKTIEQLQATGERELTEQEVAILIQEVDTEQWSSAWSEKEKLLEDTPLGRFFGWARQNDSDDNNAADRGIGLVKGLVIFGMPILIATQLAEKVSGGDPTVMFAAGLVTTSVTAWLKKLADLYDGSPIDIESPDKFSSEIDAKRHSLREATSDIALTLSLGVFGKLASSAGKFGKLLSNAFKDYHLSPEKPDQKKNNSSGGSTEARTPDLGSVNAAL